MTTVKRRSTSTQTKHPLQELFASQDIHFADPSGQRASWDIVPTDPCNVPVILNEFARTKTLGFGNTYIRGLWNCADLPELFRRLFQAKAGFGGIIFEASNSLQMGLHLIKHKSLNLPLTKQLQAAEHYDLPVELFTNFLGSSMKYTTGDWRDIKYSPKNLDAAQNQNLDDWLSDLRIKNGDVVLDVGCGWGAFPQRLVARGLDVTYLGVTISEVQLAHLREKFAARPSFHFANHSFHESYRSLLDSLGLGRVDKVICLESTEHAGNRNLPHVYANIREVLSPKGLLGIQIISADHVEPIADPYVGHYIFPNLEIPALSTLGEVLEHHRQFRLLKFENIAESYPNTLRAWHWKFNDNWARIEPHIAEILPKTYFQNTTEWRRHWNFYFQLCEGAYLSGSYPQLYKLLVQPLV